MLKTALTVLSGAVLAFAFLLSCGDDSPATADAREACDCPAAETPLAGRIVRVVGTARTVPAGEPGLAGANCPTGAIFLSGGCEIKENQSDVTLHEAFSDVDGQGWNCEWRNPSVSDVTGEASAICLVPPAE